MNEIQELYNVLANQTKITEAREEDCNLNDLIKIAVDSERNMVYTISCGGIGGRYDIISHFLADDGKIYSASQYDKNQKFESRSEAIEYSKIQLLEIQAKLSKKDLTETCVDLQFMQSGAARFMFVPDELRNPDQPGSGSEESFNDWLGEIEGREGILTYCHRMPGLLGKCQEDKMNKPSYNDAYLDLVMPHQTHLVTKLPREMKLNDALSQIPGDLTAIDVAPFKLFSHEILDFR